MVEYARFVAKLSAAPRIFHLTEILNIYSKKSVDEQDIMIFYLGQDVITL